MRTYLSLLAALTLISCTPDPGATTTTLDPTTGGPGSFGSTDTGVGTGTEATSDTDVPTTGESPTSDASTDATTTAITTDVTTDVMTGSTGDDTTGGPAIPEDEALLRQAIAGEVDAGDALQTISERGGFPVGTAAGTYMFACLCGAGEWNLAGMHNAWADAPLEAAGPLLWIEAEVPAPDGSLYKFHDTTSESWIADPLGRRYGYDDNGRYSLVRASAAHLERWYAVEGAGVQPRDLQVYVPDGGSFTHALYVHDGQNLFDPGAFFGGWKLQESVPADMLLVGIDNTPARFEEYTQVADIIDQDEIGGQAAAYAEFVDATVRPRMEAAYGEAEIVGTMGSSLGGLVSLVIADQYPDRYAMALSMSGTLGWGSITLENETIIERYAAAGKRDFAIYLDSGGQGPCADTDMDGIEDDSPGAFDNYCENAQMRDVLTGLGYSEGVDLWYVHSPGAMHNEAEWAARAGAALADFAGL